MRRWPDWMPVPRKEGYAFQADDRRTRPDFGVFADMVDEFGMEEDMLECSLALDTIQCAWLESFEADILWQGAQWFEMPLLSGQDLTWHKVRMRERPSMSKLTGCAYTFVTLKLEVDTGPGEEPGGEEMPSWPEEFPLPLQESYTYSPYDRRSSAQMEVGNLRRVEYLTDESSFQCAAILTRAELDRLKTFVHKDLKRGTRWFLMPLQSAGTIDFHVARLKALPRVESFSGLAMRVTLNLDVWQRNLMCGWVTELLSACNLESNWIVAGRDFNAFLNSIDYRLPAFGAEGFGIGIGKIPVWDGALSGSASESSCRNLVGAAQ